MKLNLALNQVTRLVVHVTELESRILRCHGGFWEMEFMKEADGGSFSIEVT